MDWIKDKKNQPIVITIAVVVLIGAIVGFLFQAGVLGGAGGGGVAANPPPPPSSPPPVAPNGPPLPDAPNAPILNPAAKPGTPAPPRIAANVDPFSVSGALVPKTETTKTPSVSAFLPFVSISRLAPKITNNEAGQKLPPLAGDQPPELSTTQRMSGVLFTDKGIVGLLETNGQTQQVYPGDTTTDGTARIISIQSDGMILRRQSDNRLVRVPLTSVATGPSTVITSGPPAYGNPGGPPDNGDNGDNQ